MRTWNIDWILAGRSTAALGTSPASAAGFPQAGVSGVFGAIAASALCGTFGVAIGSVVRNQVGAIVGGLMWVLFAESILFALVPSVGRYLPATAANVLTRIDTRDQLPVTAGVLVFCAYIAVAVAAAVLVTERRDVP